MARTFPSIGVSPLDAYITDARPGLYIEQVITLPSTSTVFAARIKQYPTVISGGKMRGLSVLVEALAGSGGASLIGITGIAEQDTTKRVDGYMAGGAFTVISGAAQAGAMYCVELTYKNTASSPGQPIESHAYIGLRDYSTTVDCSNIFYFVDASPSADDDVIFATQTSWSVSHTLRMRVGSTTYYIGVSTAR